MIEIKLGLSPRKVRNNTLNPVVYFARHHTLEAIKIGLSANLSARLATLSRAHGKLTLLGAFPGTRVDEYRIHDLFASDRINVLASNPLSSYRTVQGASEWFRVTPALLGFIERDGKLVENTEAV